jgi:hypothetical protein
MAANPFERAPSPDDYLNSEQEGAPATDSALLRAALARAGRRPGATGTVRDWEIAMAQTEAWIRREHPDVTDAEALAAATKVYERLLYDANLLREYVRLTPLSTTPDREGVRPNIEALAIRGLPEWQAMEAMLRRPQRRSRSDLILQMAVFNRMVLCPGQPEIRANVRDFAGADAELDLAFLDSIHVHETRHLMRDESSVRRTLKAMLERADPYWLHAPNLALVKRLQDRYGGDVGRYLAVDVTKIEAHVMQHWPASAELRRLQLRGTGAKYIYHAGKGGAQGDGWAGWGLLVIVDMMTGLPLIWKLIQGSEYPHVTSLITRLLTLAPWLQPEYLVGDSEYDSHARVAFDLEHLFGIHPVFDLRDHLSTTFPHHATLGVPHCAAHGAMTRDQANHFTPVAPGTPYEPDFERAKRASQARIRWICSECSVRETTYMRVNPRIYTFLPRGGDHRLASMRAALMIRRDTIESVFSALKRRGIGRDKEYRAKWVTSPIHLEWLCGAALFGMTANRVIFEFGEYDVAAKYVNDLGILKVDATWRRIR